MELVIISGMSGAGKTTALHILEDLGYYCTDNIPPQLMSELALALDSSKTSGHDKVAMVADIRMGHFFSGIYSAIEKIKALGYACKLLFLDASDESIVSRYNLTKRKHPMAKDGSILHGVLKERETLAKIKDMSDFVIDTSKLSEKKFKEQVRSYFASGEEDFSRVQLVSFGFKRGMPGDLDMMFDMRYLPNPFYDENLREHTGLETEVAAYIFADKSNITKVQWIAEYIKSILKDYIHNSKESLVVGIGCTGGKHRSVASLEIIYSILEQAGIRVTKEHRDINL